MRLEVWAVPGARCTGIEGERDGCLRVRLSAPARKGRANDALVRFLAERLAVRREDVTIVGGAQSRRKVVWIRGVTLETAVERLAP